jgi:hypothetical protein
MARKLFVNGRPVGGMCDRCGQRYPLESLKTEYLNGYPTNLLVCPQCWDRQHEQEPDRWPVPDDEQSIENPRPEINEDIERSMWGWNPVGNSAVLLSLNGGKVYAP